MVLNNALKGDSITYSPNCVVSIDEVAEKRHLKVREDMVASEEGTLCKINVLLDVAPSPISVQVKSRK